MDTWIIVLIVAVVIAAVIVAFAVWSYLRARRSRDLRDKFGPEYDRTVRAMGRGAGERDLQARESRVRVLDIRPLSRDQYERYTSAWTSTQARFVDDPSSAISEADDLVADVMRARGYPVEDDFEARAADISVDHPEVVENYRAAHATAVRHEQGDATTEELRQAMVKYRSLFSELLESGETRGSGGRLVPEAEHESR
jgi:hypothetical protein